MDATRLETLDDPRLAPYRNLPLSNLTRGSGLFVVEGPLLVERLLASDYVVDSLLVDEQRLEKWRGRIPPGTPVYAVEARQIEQIIGFNFHRGILACGRRRPARLLAEALPSQQARATVVVAVEIHDQGNLGGLLRNCAAFGVDAVLLSPRSADPFSRRVLRVSMGAALRLAICESADLAADLAWLSDHEFSLAATVLDPEATPLETATRPPRLAILFGNEAHGLPPEVVARCDQRLTLAMRHGTDSLNVAVASGVFLYHATRLCPADGC